MKMGFLSKFIGAIAGDKGIDEMVKQVIDTTKETVTNNAAPKNAPKPQTPAAAPMAAPKSAEEKSGRSWGPTMPQEENQFSFKGTYKEYFSGIFKAEFSDFKVEQSTDPKRDAEFFTFIDASGKTRLFVEVMSRKTNAQRRKTECVKNNIPYLRFYHDYHGWWNTRSYVIDRVRGQLGA